MRTLIAILATHGLITVTAAIPAAAQTPTPTCEVTAEGSTTEDVTDGVSLTFDGDFACADAASTGTWSVVVTVANGSEVDVIIESIELSHATPAFGDDEANTVDDDSLPLAVPAGSESSFDVEGAYALESTDEGELVNLHLRAAGVTDDDEAAPFILGINVHLLGPGVELDDENAPDSGEGRPSWAPGPPPWVIETLRGIFGDTFPWGTDTFPPADDSSDADADADADAEAETQAEAEAEADAGPPSGLTLPPPAASRGDDEGDEVAGPPSWVNPGGPPASVPRGDEGTDGEAGPPAGAGRP